MRCNPRERCRIFRPTHTGTQFKQHKNAVGKSTLSAICFSLRGSVRSARGKNAHQRTDLFGSLSSFALKLPAIRRSLLCWPGPPPNLRYYLGSAPPPPSLDKSATPCAFPPDFLSVARPFRGAFSTVTFGIPDHASLPQPHLCRSSQVRRRSDRPPLGLGPSCP